MSEEARKAAWEKWLNDPTGIGGFDAGWKAHAEHTAEIIKAAEALVAILDDDLNQCLKGDSFGKVFVANFCEELTALKAALEGI